MQTLLKPLTIETTACPQVLLVVLNPLERQHVRFADGLPITETMASFIALEFVPGGHWFELVQHLAVAEIPTEIMGTAMSTVEVFALDRRAWWI